jgi:hypothetical protein
MKQSKGQAFLAYCIINLSTFLFTISCLYMQVKVLNKLASARASGIAGGSKVLTDLVEGLQEPRVAVELRLKIDQNHPDLKGGYGSLSGLSHFYIICCSITDHLEHPDLSENMERQC